MTRQTELNTNTPVCTEKRVLSVADTAEVYLTATPAPGGDLEEQIRRLYTAVRDELAAADGHLLSERLFATADAMAPVEAARNEILREFDDGVAPTRVVVSPSPTTGRFTGAQFHAVCGSNRPTVLRCWDQKNGSTARLYSSNGDKWLFINGLSSLTSDDRASQAQRMFYCAGCLLNQAGASMKAVPRTWLWLKEICSWYGDFNHARTSFFTARGLIDPVARSAQLPASTGIGLHGPGGAACTIDLIALPGREDEIEHVEAGGDQRSAFEYGSAFSRASVAPMPGGKTVFVSGTAAIDDAGRTEHTDQVEAQIDATIAHIRSLLARLDCGDEHVLSALAYCKNAAVEETFRRRWADLTWPRLTMIGEVCRPDLLFEVEVTASPDLCPAAGNSAP